MNGSVCIVVCAKKPLFNANRTQESFWQKQSVHRNTFTLPSSPLKMCTGWQNLKYSPKTFELLTKTFIPHTACLKHSYYDQKNKHCWSKKNITLSQPLKQLYYFLNTLSYFLNFFILSICLDFSHTSSYFLSF